MADSPTGTDAPAPSPQRGPRLRAALSVTARLAAELLLVTVGVVVLGYLVSRVWSVLLPVVLALFLTSVLWPAARLLRRHRWPPSLAALSTVVLFLAALAGIVLLVAPPLAQQSDAVVNGIVDGLHTVQQWLTGPPLNLGHDQVTQGVDSAISALQGHLEDVAGVVISVLTTVGSGVVDGVLALVLTFFFLKDGPRWLPWLGAQTTGRAAHHIAAVSL